MKTLFRNTVIGAIIWIIGVSLYSLSFFIPILENVEFQANLVLILAVIPLVWYGTKVSFKNSPNSKGPVVGTIFFVTAAVLDALVTVPYLVIPNGGSYYQFYTDPGFWLIGFEFILISTLYWYLNNSMNKTQTIKK